MTSYMGYFFVLLAIPPITSGTPYNRTAEKSKEVSVLELQEDEPVALTSLLYGIYTKTIGEKPEKVVVDFPFTADFPGCKVEIKTLAAMYPKETIERYQDIEQLLENEMQESGLDWSVGSRKRRIQILKGKAKALKGDDFKDIGPKYSIVAIVPLRVKITELTPQVKR